MLKDILKLVCLLHFYLNMRSIEMKVLFACKNFIQNGMAANLLCQLDGIGSSRRHLSDTSLGTFPETLN